MTTTYAAGTVIDGYRLVGLHAAGGMGSVYRAVELATGRRVALKTSARFADSVAAEAAALAAIASPRVVGVAGTGTVDGLPYVAVDWLDGEDLRAVIARGPLAIDRALRIATELCEALAAVHAAGFVHRDVKPGNVIVTADGATLLDFGLALPIGLSRAVRLGTVDYVAPELVAGARAIADPRSDVYALGCVLFECLTGRSPFETGTAAHTLLRRLLEPAPRLVASRADVPSWLDELVACLLRREPVDRPRDGGETLALLRAPDRVPVRAPDNKRDPHNHAFALVRAGAATTDETIELADHAVIDELAATCREFGIHADAPLDVLVLTAPDHDPRDQLRRLLGASVRLIERRADLHVAIVTGGDATPNALARGYALLASAAAGTALADDETRRLAPAGSAHFASATAGAYRVTARATAPARDGLADDQTRRFSPGGIAPVTTLAAAPSREPLVERDAIVNRLVDRLRPGELGPSAPSPSFAVVIGAAGMGKTAVLDAVRDARPATSLSGQLHLAGVPYHAVRAWLAVELARAGVVDEASLRVELVRRLGKRGGLHARELARLVGFSASEAHVPGDGSRDALDEAIADAMHALAPERLFVDDAQWLDPASAAALARLLARPARPAVVLAARPELRGVHPDLVARASSVDTLTPLGAAAAAELVARVAPDLAAPIIATIVRDAEGHPLILRELARAAASGELDRAPATAIGLVQARLLRLSRAGRRALSFAALLGGHVARDVLVRLLDDDRAVLAELAAKGIAADAGDTRSPRFATALAELAAERILIADAGDERTLRFATALVAEAADALVPAAERVALHAAIARDLAADPATEPAALLRHAIAAGVDELVTLAHVLAAERAAVLFDFETARAAARDAIAAGADGELYARSRLCEAEALLVAERYAEADVRAREAADHVRRGSLRWTYACAIRTRVLHRRLEPEAAMVLFDELATLACDEGAASRVRLQCLIHIAGNLVLVGHLAAGEARSAIVETMAAREALAPELGAELHRLRARRAAAAGDWERYRTESERAAELHDSRGNVLEAALARVNIAHAWFELGDGARAVAMSRAVVDEVTQLELPYALGYARFLLGFFLRREGDAAGARIELQRALEDADEEPRRAGEIAVELALDALDRDDVVEATRHADRAIVLLAPAPTHVAQANAVRAAVHLRAGELAEAAACIARARAAAVPLGIMVEDLTFVRLVELEVGAALHDPHLADHAATALAELDERERRLGDPELAQRFRARADNARLREVATSLRH